MLVLLILLGIYFYAYSGILVQKNHVQEDAEKVVFELITASWYGPGFHGRKTASGTLFNMYEHTAAHTKLPFNTEIKLVNPKNNRSVIVTITDRGPYDPTKLRRKKSEKLNLVPHPTRDIDISRAAAIALGIREKGVARLYAAIVQ